MRQTNLRTLFGLYYMFTIRLYTVTSFLHQNLQFPQQSIPLESSRYWRLTVHNALTPLLVDPWGQGIQPRVSPWPDSACNGETLTDCLYWYHLIEWVSDQTGRGVPTALHDRIGLIVDQIFTKPVHKLLPWEQTCPLQFLLSLDPSWSAAMWWLIQPHRRQCSFLALVPQYSSDDDHSW